MNKPTGKIEAGKKEQKPGTINIHGKQYQTVALRVQMFREAHPDWSLITSVMDRDAQCVVMQATIADAEGRVIATGHAEEYRTSSQINKTSALENAETSAIGRALAALGLGGTEFATANEVQNAIHQQGAPKAKDAPFPQGPARNKMDLKEKGRAFWKDVEACGDEDELTALIATHVPLVSQIKEVLPEWWHGGTKESGEPFEGLGDVIDKRLTDFRNVRTVIDAG